ncbi:DegT/DnrJ/EryC1/StrS aminotransferase family protein [Cryobacterium sp. TMS1-20-1]|uniref:DegT/DnrJ/EryC1/StrS family aminotransferase n=1 Tax=Cryobacterium sp. TMS1-20-1 TaxID=1259223 RepID=UPI00141B9566|nr:DegT/DnrJ/EryC1/StrS family aminotransferase [Cryobacterium sp. TMS1-20-1]
MNDLSRGIEWDRFHFKSALKSVLDSGFVEKGFNHAAFAAELASYLGVSKSIGVVSGIDALKLSSKAAGPQGRNLVLTAANAGGYTSTAAKRADFNTVFVDVEKGSLCMSAETIDAGLIDDVGVVLVTHLYGNFTDIQEIVEQCDERGIQVVEDCAESIGARRESRFAGSVGDFAAISFYLTKNLGAIGDGGAVVTTDAELTSKVRQLSQNGGDSKCSVELPGGLNSQLDAHQAALLTVRLPLLDSFDERRYEIVGRYAAAAVGTSITLMPADTDSHVAHLAVARSANRERAQQALRQANDMTDVYLPVPYHWQPGFGSSAVSLPITILAFREVFSLPCFPELMEEKILTVCDAIGTLA